MLTVHKLIGVYTLVQRTTWDARMLIQFSEEQRVFTFAQLYWRTTELLMPFRMEKKTAVTLGPVSDRNPGTVQQNVDALHKKARELSKEGFYVLDVASFRPIFERIVTELGIAGYPFGIVEEFTKPLIHNGWFQHIYIRRPFDHSTGTMMEYETATRARRLHNIEIRGFS